jgi:hypothetical protein
MDGDGSLTNQALLQWRTTLERIYTIKQLGQLAETHSFAISLSIKRSAEDMEYTIESEGSVESERSPKRVALDTGGWDIYRVKREVVGELSW